MQKKVKQYYGKDITIYEYKPAEAVELVEVVSFGAAIEVLKHGALRLPEGREPKQLIAYGQSITGSIEYLALIDGLSVKQALNIMLDLGCDSITMQDAELTVDLGGPEKSILDEHIDTDLSGNSDSIVSDQPGIISWEEMTITADTIKMEDIVPKKDKKRKRK